jgi:hypothetical protein
MMGERNGGGKRRGGRERAGAVGWLTGERQERRTYGLLTTKKGGRQTGWRREGRNPCDYPYELNQRFAFKHERGRQDGRKVHKPATLPTPRFCLNSKRKERRRGTQRGCTAATENNNFCLSVLLCACSTPAPSYPPTNKPTKHQSSGSASSTSVTSSSKMSASQPSSSPTLGRVRPKSP